MPRCGSQVPICDVPVRFDTYSGCSHNCTYCFTRRKLDSKISEDAEIEKSEGVQSLRNFIEGERKHEVNWCDWDIPIHIGGMSDPFQPIEAKHRRTYECLKLLAETQYPFIISTKGRLAATPEYMDLLANCNVCFQVSLVSPGYNKLESGAPSFEERIEMIRKISAIVPRLNIRIQPYMQEELENILNITLPQAKAAGVYGVTIEGMKAWAGKLPGMEQVGGDFCYPTWLLEEHFTKIRNRAKELGLAFYCGENRLRRLSDSLCCCGIDGMDGFKPNTYNLNHIYAGEDVKPTAKMQEVGTTVWCKTLMQTAWSGDVLDQLSYAACMEEIAKSKYGYSTMGLEIETKSKSFDLRM